jgi:hypothetical protein
MVAGTGRAPLTTPPIETEPDLATPPDGFPRPRPGLSTGTRVGIVISAVAALVIGAGASFAVFTFFHAVRDIEAGDCVHLTGVVAGDFERVPCRSANAAFRIERKTTSAGSGTCPGEDYTRFFYNKSNGYDDSSDRVTLCLALNVTDGECLNSIDDKTAILKAPCGTPEARVKAAVHSGSTDSGSCGDDDLALVYDGPPARTVCLRELGLSI